MASTPAASHFDGFATMYMRMPMSTSSLPIQGQCIVDDRRITLKFPFTGIEFELPDPPSTILHRQLERQAVGDKTPVPDFEFKIRGARGDLTMTIGYVAELRTFTGVGRQEDDSDLPVLSFCFYPPDSALALLPRI